MKATCFVLPAVVAIASFGCDEEQGPVREVDRSGVSPLADGTWASSPWTVDDLEREGFIEIEPSSSITLLHGLGSVPVDVHVYVAFSRDSERLMPASGNAAEIHEVTDQHVTIRNGSGGSFFYRVVLR